VSGFLQGTPANKYGKWNGLSHKRETNRFQM
jgi:hypothetical protein